MRLIFWLISFLYPLIIFLAVNREFKQKIFFFYFAEKNSKLSRSQPQKSFVCLKKFCRRISPQYFYNQFFEVLFFYRYFEYNSVKISNVFFSFATDAGLWSWTQRLKLTVGKNVSFARFLRPILSFRI